MAYVAKKYSEMTPQEREHKRVITSRAIKKRRVKLKAEGKCVDCGKPREEGRVAICAKCAADRLVREHRRWARDIPKGI